MPPPWLQANVMPLGKSTQRGVGSVGNDEEVHRTSTWAPGKALTLMWGSRSQSKKQAALMSSLAKGDRVITQSGLDGKFLEMNDRIAKIEISPGVKVEVLRSGIMGKDTPETAAAVDKAITSAVAPAWAK